MEEFFSAFGFMFQFWKALLTAVAVKGGTEYDLARVMRNPKLSAKLAQVIVDHPETLAYMIEAGDYDERDGNINERNFPVQERGENPRNLVVVDLGKEATTDEVLAELDRRGLRPARIEDLLTFLPHQEPEYNRTLVALGSFWVDDNISDKRRFVEFSLGEERRRGEGGCGSRRRNLSLSYGDDWDKHFQFLAVSKKAKSAKADK